MSVTLSSHLSVISDSVFNTMDSSEDNEQSLSDYVLLNMPYRKLQQVSKRLKLPGNIKRNTMLLLIQARRDGNEKPIKEFYTLRKDLQARKEAEKQKIIQTQRNLGLHLPSQKAYSQLPHSHMERHKYFQHKVESDLKEKSCQWSLNRLQSNLQMTSHCSPMFSKHGHMIPQPPLGIPLHQYYNEPEGGTECCSFYQQYSGMSISDKSGNNKTDVSTGHQEGYTFQQNSNPEYNPSIMQNHYSDEEIDVGEEYCGSDDYYKKDYNSVFSNWSNENEKPQINQELSLGGMIPSFETQQTLTHTSDMNTPYPHSHMLASILHKKEKVVHSTQEAIPQHGNIPEHVTFTIFYPNGQQQQILKLKQPQPMISPKVSTPLSAADSGIDSPVFSMQDKQIKWKVPITSCEKEKVDEMIIDKCDGDANFTVTCEASAVNPNVNWNCLNPNSSHMFDCLDNQEMPRQRYSNQNSENLSIPESIPESAIDVAEKVYQEQLFCCRNFDNGCTKQLYHFQIVDHEKYCHYQKITCLYLNCDWANILKNLPNHLCQIHSNYIEQNDEKNTPMKLEMYKMLFQNKIFSYMQYYNERLFVISVECDEEHLYITMQFMPDGKPVTHYGGIEIFLDKAEMNRNGLEIPPPIKWCGIVEPYHQLLKTVSPSSNYLIVKCNSLTENFNIYTNVNFTSEQNGIEFLDKLRERYDN